MVILSQNWDVQVSFGGVVALKAFGIKALTFACLHTCPLLTDCSLVSRIGQELGEWILLSSRCKVFLVASLEGQSWD